MKKRRSSIIIFVVVAALCLGIGYAALTDVLDITGTADINQSAAEEEFNEDVCFTDAKPLGDGTPNTASVNADNKDKASFTAKDLAGKGDTASFEFTITNAGDVDATVTPTLNATTGNTKPEYFSITSDWGGASKTLAAGQSLTYTVTVELLKTPTETISGSFLIELTATSVGAVESGTGSN